MTAVKRLLHALRAAASWLARPPDFEPCRWANESDEEGTQP